MTTFYQVFLAICVVGFVFYLYVDRQNELIKLQIELPQLRKQVHLLEEENRQLLFEIEQWENPKRLMQLRQEMPFRHFTEPLEDKIITLEAP